MTTLVAWPTYSLMTNQLALLQWVFMRMSVFSAVQKPHKWLVLSCWYTPHPASWNCKTGQTSHLSVRQSRPRVLCSNSLDRVLLRFPGAEDTVWNRVFDKRVFCTRECLSPSPFRVDEGFDFFPPLTRLQRFLFFFPSSNQIYAQYIHISMQNWPWRGRVSCSGIYYPGSHYYK